MRTDDFDYNLPDELIAQEPAAHGSKGLTWLTRAWRAVRLLWAWRVQAS